MKKMITLFALTLTLTTSTFASEATQLNVKDRNFLQVAKILKIHSGKKLTPIEIQFIKGFTAGDGSNCDPLVPDCSGCGWFEKYMCKGMIINELIEIQ